MIERVARRLLACTIANGGVHRGEGSWRDHVDDAREIIASMRTPSVAMAQAGSTVHEEADYPTSGVDAATVRERMIDAALKGE